jgi:hypothetical protein
MHVLGYLCKAFVVALWSLFLTKNQYVDIYIVLLIRSYIT